MSAPAALMAARHAGISLAVDGDDLLLQADGPPSAALLDLIRLHKEAIKALLARDDVGWSGEEWLAQFDERAGILEFDEGLPRAEAERLAAEEVTRLREHRDEHDPVGA